MYGAVGGASRSRWGFFQPRVVRGWFFRAANGWGGDFLSLRHKDTCSVTASAAPSPEGGGATKIHCSVMGHEARPPPRAGELHWNAECRVRNDRLVAVQSEMSNSQFLVPSGHGRTSRPCHPRSPMSFTTRGAPLLISIFSKRGLPGLWFTDASTSPRDSMCTPRGPRLPVPCGRSWG